MSQDEPVVTPCYAGMREDIEDLLQQFVERGSPRMTKFAETFKAAQFSKIFAGRIAPPELVEFSERLLQMAVSYIHPYRLPATPIYTGLQTLDSLHQKQAEKAIFDQSMTRPMLERIFGIYLTYALFFLQPSDYVVQVRVTPIQLMEITQLQKELIDESHYDTVAALLKLHAHKAFVQVPFGSSYDPVTHKRFEISDEDSLGHSSMGTSDRQTSSVERIAGDSLLKQLEVLSKASHEVNYTKEVEEMRGIALRAHAELIVNEIKSPAETNNVSKPSRTAIREKAYARNIKHNRNRRYANPENEPGALTLARFDEANGGNEGERGDGPSVTKKGKQSDDQKQLDVLFDETLDGNKKEISKFKSEMDQFEQRSPGKNSLKTKPKQARIRDPELEDEIRKALAPSALQRSNDRLLEKLKRSVRKETN